MNFYEMNYGHVIKRAFHSVLYNISKTSFIKVHILISGERFFHQLSLACRDSSFLQVTLYKTSLYWAI